LVGLVQQRQKAAAGGFAHVHAFPGRPFQTRPESQITPRPGQSDPLPGRVYVHDPSKLGPPPPPQRTCAPHKRSPSHPIHPTHTAMPMMWKQLMCLVVVALAVQVQAFLPASRYVRKKLTMNDDGTKHIGPTVGVKKRTPAHARVFGRPSCSPSPTRIFPPPHPPGSQPARPSGEWGPKGRCAWRGSLWT
jgi:hypothetical protein